MFKTLALTIALFGSAAADDCAPVWTGLHSEGDIISYTETVTTYYCCYTSDNEDCAMTSPSTPGCTCKNVSNLASPTSCAKGLSQTMVEDESYNYVCKNGVQAFCNDATYQPRSNAVDYSAAAWEKDDEQCDVSFCLFVNFLHRFFFSAPHYTRLNTQDIYIFPSSSTHHHPLPAPDCPGSRSR